MKKIWIVFLILALAIFLVNGCGSQNVNQNNQNLNQDTFSSCKASSQTVPFGQGGTYTIRIIGPEKGTCHWQYAIQIPQLNQTNDCFYPLENMSDKAFQHLFGADKTGTECSSDLCKQQDGLQQTYCKPV